MNISESSSPDNTVEQKHLLIVDDFKLFQDILKGYLENSDVSVAVAFNGLEALEQVRCKRPKIIFLDLNMPQMKGDSCCRILKEDPELSDIPVIMLISSNNESDRATCLAAGCNDIITKPINRRIFLEAVSRYVLGIERRDARYPYQSSAVFSNNCSTYAGVTLDISSGGIYLSTDEWLDQEERVTLTIVVDGVVLDVWGRVAWSNYGKDRVKPSLEEGVGIEFLDMTPTSAERLRELMKSLSTE